MLGFSIIYFDSLQASIALQDLCNTYSDGIRVTLCSYTNKPYPTE
jgi:hypothetical protein